MVATQWIVKLIGIGNPEDRLFALETVGGVDPIDGVEDFVGWHLQRFSFTTDGSGQFAVTLAHTPLGITNCFCMVAEDQRVIAPVSLVGDVLTVQKRKLVYDKADTPTGLVTGQPGGVSIASALTSTGATDTGGGGGSISVTTGAVGGGAGDAVTDVSFTPGGSGGPHTHTIDSLYDHRHGLTYTPTSLGVAGSEATVLLVLYQ